MSKKNKKAAKAVETVIKVCLFGDSEEKNREFLANYLKGRDIINKADTVEINKMLEGSQYKISLFTCAFIDEKIVTFVQENNCVFILFDMTERSCFDNLLDKWLIWLRDNCKFEGKIIIFGDYDKNCSDNDFFLATNDDEVDEVIKCAEIKDAVFHRIGELSEEEKKAKIDEILLTVKPVPVEVENNEQGMSLKDGCFVV